MKSLSWFRWDEWMCAAAHILPWGQLDVTYCLFLLDHSLSTYVHQCRSTCHGQNCKRLIISPKWSNRRACYFYTPFRITLMSLKMTGVSSLPLTTLDCITISFSSPKKNLGLLTTPITGIVPWTSINVKFTLFDFTGSSWTYHLTPSWESLVSYALANSEKKTCSEAHERSALLLFFVLSPLSSFVSKACVFVQLDRLCAWTSYRISYRLGTWTNRDMPLDNIGKSVYDRNTKELNNLLN